MTAPRVSVSCHQSYAFEVGQSIDLDACERVVASSSRQPVPAGRRVPPGFVYRPAPLRLGETLPSASVPGLTPARAEIVLYDFGAAAVSFAFRYEGPLEGLLPVSVAFQADVAGLANEARARVTRVIAILGTAVSRPAIGTEFEDYAVFEIDRAATPITVGSAELRPTLAGILRGSSDRLSEQEIHDALSGRLSYRDDDLTLIDWNAAILLDPEADETRMVLEFANVQLLEFRHLDGQLDQAVDRAYDALAKAERGIFRRFRPPVQAFRSLALLQMDGAVLFERVSNALKLVGDQFLGRVYQTASARFHLDDWDRAITRKLDVLDGLYQKTGDQVSARRLEVLEWIVIALIAMELVLR